MLLACSFCVAEEKDNLPDNQSAEWSDLLQGVVIYYRTQYCSKIVLRL